MIDNILSQTTFAIAAEYLHTRIGRTISINLNIHDPADRYSVRIGAVRYEPETGHIIVDAYPPIGPQELIIGLVVTPGTIVQVHHDH